MRPILLIMWTAFQSFILRHNNNNNENENAKHLDFFHFAYINYNMFKPHGHNKSSVVVFHTQLSDGVVV